MGSRNSFIINALIEVIYQWNDRQLIPTIKNILMQGVQGNELRGYFDTNDIARALTEMEKDG